MEKIVSCCGVVCSDCEYYPASCTGCPDIRGKVFWLSYTGEEICQIYRCCVEEHVLPHCGKCSKLPCAQYTEGEGDPTKTPEENAEIYKQQLKLLGELP